MAEPVQSAREYDLSFLDFPVRIKIPLCPYDPATPNTHPMFSRHNPNLHHMALLLSCPFHFLSIYPFPKQTTEHQRADVILLLLIT